MVLEASKKKKKRLPMTDILKIPQNMCVIFTADDSNECGVRRLTGGLGGAGYVTVVPKAWSQSFPLKIKSMCAI